MCESHLLNPRTYQVVANYNPAPIWKDLIDILVKYKKYYCTERRPGPIGERSRLADSLLQLKDRKELRVPAFSAWPKMHKKPVENAPFPPSRPIVSSPSSITYYASVYLHNIFYPFVKKLNTICFSSRSVILDVHNLHIPSNSVLLCADVASLYPSIPIDFGLEMVRKVCTSKEWFDPVTLEWILVLLEFVLRNNFCYFNGCIFLQLIGTAMGTPVAVCYANIVLYAMERPILDKLLYTLYRRYIDDVFAVLLRQAAVSFITDFNAVNSSIQFEAVTIDSTGVFLDLQFRLTDNTTHYSISHSLFQKPSSKYQYICPLSQHAPHIFENFILQELKRYRLSCTNEDDFNSLIPLFDERLRRRGYSSCMLRRALLKLPSREALLRPLLSPPILHNCDVITPPLIILQVPRLYPPIKWKSLFSIPPTIHGLREYRAAYGNLQVVVGNSNFPSIARYIMRTRFELCADN
jgi:hypothetical protein